MRFAFLISIFLVFLILGCVQQSDENVKILNNLGMHAVGSGNKIDVILAENLSETAEWGIIEDICNEGGYNLTKYAGQTIELDSYSISEMYDNVPLNAHIISSINGEIICVYKSMRGENTYAPGVFPVNNSISK